jgi:diadenosine tetraphosphate (Ap4A) HIT family hydrolase
MTQTDCIFCARAQLDVVAENERCFAVRDIHPVKPLHTLIVAKRCVATPFELRPDELADMLALADRCRRDIEALDPSVAGFNFGANVGAVAGQRIMHVHFHLIPRRPGDLPPPAARER